MPWLRKPVISFLQLNRLRSNDAFAASLRAAAAMGRPHIQGGAASWDSSDGEHIGRPALRCCEPYGFLSDAWVCEFQSAHHGVNACVVSSRGFGSAAGFSVFQLWVQEGATQSALAKSCPRPVSKSFLHVGEVVVRRQDTPRTRVQVTRAACGRHACGTGLRSS